MTEPTFETTTERLYARLPDVLRKSDRVVNFNLKTFLSALGDIQSDVDLLHARMNYLHPEDRVRPTDVVEPNTTYSYPERVRTRNSEGFLSDQTVAVRKQWVRNPRAIGNPGSQSLTGFGVYSAGIDETGELRQVPEGRDGPSVQGRNLGYLEWKVETQKSSGSTGWNGRTAQYWAEKSGVAGDKITVSIYARYIDSGSHPQRMRLRAQTMTGTTIVTLADSDFYVMTPGEWIRVSSTVTSSGPYTSVGWWLYQTGSAGGDQVLPAGSRFGVGGPLIEEGDVLKKYFDGNSFYANEVQYEADWESVVDMSPSIETQYEVQERVLNGLRSDLVDARYADDAWLPWIAQMLGADITHLQSEEEVRNLLTSPAVFEAGSYNSIYNAVKSQLSGTQYMKLYRNTVDVLHPGEATEWDILIVTKNSETPEFSQILEAVERNQARPAGVRLYHDTYESSWQAVEASYPTWAEWEGATWEEIEETGLS